MNRLSPQRRKVAALGGASAAISAGLTPLVNKHPRATLVYLVLVVGLLAYTIAQLVKLKREEGR